LIIIGNLYGILIDGLVGGRSKVTANSNGN